MKAVFSLDHIYAKSQSPLTNQFSFYLSKYLNQFTNALVQGAIGVSENDSLATPYCSSFQGRKLLPYTSQCEGKWILRSYPVSERYVNLPVLTDFWSRSAVTERSRKICFVQFQTVQNFVSCFQPLNELIYLGSFQGGSNFGSFTNYIKHQCPLLLKKRFCLTSFFNLGCA